MTAVTKWKTTGQTPPTLSVEHSVQVLTSSVLWARLPPPCLIIITTLRGDCYPNLREKESEIHSTRVEDRRQTSREEQRTWIHAHDISSANHWWFGIWAHYWDTASPETEVLTQSPADLTWPLLQWAQIWRLLKGCKAALGKDLCMLNVFISHIPSALWRLCHFFFFFFAGPTDRD